MKYTLGLELQQVLPSKRLRWAPEDPRGNSAPGPEWSSSDHFIKASGLLRLPEQRGNGPSAERWLSGLVSSLAKSFKEEETISCPGSP